ncbi:hypothetical protein LPW26_07975 [Rhodopseudomonas sp. HC1]|uniref:hypothetical protein n=1 Tax=Rhodopseudomonas infernalis TaxID=2897386 RepID=UPI001EE85842|nr:hypothetical protein [Rhodopseudomonas infernalis]MCG6204568.1 hypothetical protein [Rhodopseudomonas infernalis]
MKLQGVFLTASVLSLDPAMRPAVDRGPQSLYFSTIRTGSRIARVGFGRPTIPERTGTSLEKFVREENLKLYRRLLSETQDEERRRVLLQLMASLNDRDRQMRSVR